MFKTVCAFVLSLGMALACDKWQSTYNFRKTGSSPYADWGGSRNRFNSMNSLISQPTVDNSTFGNTEQIHTSHLYMQLDVDFDNE